MLSFLRNRPRPSPPTFNERVTAFWTWFQEVGPRFYATINAGQCASLADETSAKVNELFPGFAWVYGPGEKGIGHSFTLSGEGIENRQLLALHWLAQAPQIEGWTFYPARQSGPIKGRSIQVLNQAFSPTEIWVTADVRVDDELIDITAWHPAWETMEERQRMMILFIFLDESLGEYGTQWWIGRIHLGKDRLAESFPLEELADFVRDTSVKHGWKKYPPGESWTLFTVKQQDTRFPRGDIITQNTAAPRLFQEYMRAGGELEDPLRGTGADYVFVSIGRDYFPPKHETDARAEVEEALDVALREVRSGRSLGGALGLERGYVDLLIYDGAESISIIQKTLRAFSLPSGSMIEYFAREKRGQRIVL